VYSTIQGGVVATDDAAIAQGLEEYWRAAPRSGHEFTRALLENVLLECSIKATDHPRTRRARRLARRLWGDSRLVSTPPEEEQGLRPSHYGRRMAAPVAALGLNQLRKIDANNAIRRERALHWAAWARANGLPVPLVIDRSDPVHLRFPTLVPPEMKRDTSWGAAATGVEVGVWFRSQLHPRPGVVPDCPAAMEAVTSCVNLPTR
jgi:dTDP-4-amino-4,6-dideoxygalactose transaminase